MVDRTAVAGGEVAGAAEDVLEIPGGGAGGDLRDQGVQAVAVDSAGFEGIAVEAVEVGPGVAAGVVGHAQFRGKRAAAGRVDVLLDAIAGYVVLEGDAFVDGAA